MKHTLGLVAALLSMLNGLPSRPVEVSAFWGKFSGAKANIRAIVWARDPQ
jgi:hypothetical protein